MTIRSINASKIRVLQALVLALALTGPFRKARAEPAAPTAEELFEGGRAAMKQGNYAAARDRFVASLRLERTVGTLFNLSLCEEKLGALADAIDHLESALAIADSDDRRRGPMADLVRVLEARAPRLTIRLASEGAGDVEITLDGLPVDRATLGRSRRLNPGDHQIVARGAKGPSETVSIHLNEGDDLDKTIEWRHAGGPPATAAPAPPAIAMEPGHVPSHAEASRWIGAGAVTAGGAALLAGGVLGYMVLGRKVIIDHHCNNGSECDAEGAQAISDGKSLATACNVATGVGVAGVVAGSYLLLMRGTDVADAPDRTMRTVGYVAASVGAVALISSAVAASTALAADREVADRCSAGACRDAQALDAGARGRTAATVSTIGFGIGVAGLGLASYSLLFRPLMGGSSEARLTLGPSEISYFTRF
jgi:hypothetical protein